MNRIKRFSMIAFVLALLFTLLPDEANPLLSVTQAAAPARLGNERRAVWIWGSTVRTKGAEAVATVLKDRGITDAILLVKGSAGTVAYPSAIAPEAAAGTDALGDFLVACHARGIKVHAWLNYHQDDYFGITKSNYKYSIWHSGKPPGTPDPYQVKDGRICPLRAKEEYNQYYLSLVQEILQLYPVDGIHFDYIRYPHVVYCFCPQHLALAAERDISIANVRGYINQTYYTPGDQKSYFNAYANGDPDVTKWVGMRVDEINSVAEMVKDALDEYNVANGTSVELSAALMPEGALASTMATDQARTDQFGLCHYAQSYEDLSKLMSFIAPMAYHKDYGQPPSWVGTVTAGAVAKAAATPVLAGIQVYSVTAQDIVDALYAARWNGASGFVLFRYGVSTSADAAWAAIVPDMESLATSLEAAFDAGWIDNAGIYNSLAQLLKNAQKSIDRSNIGAARNQLAAIVHELNAQSGKHIDARAAGILAGDVNWVSDLLQ